MINAASKLLARSAPLPQRRAASTQYLALKSRGFKTNWLSDPSTYPLILCLSGAMALCTGFGLNFLRTSKDVRIAGAKKRTVIRDW